MAEDINYVYLQCVKVARKLRVRITTKGYISDANCQFPKNLRKEGAQYRIKQQYIKFGAGPRGKFFYRIPAKHIEVVGGKPPVEMKVYDVDESIMECAVCYDHDKSHVFVPCGHYCTCEDCARTLKKCPLCRTSIDMLVARSDIEV